MLKMGQDVNYEINQKKNQLDNINASMKRLDSLKTEIDEAIEKLERANRYFKAGDYALEVNYDGKASKKFKNDINDSMEKIDKTVRELKAIKTQLDVKKRDLSNKANNLQNEITVLQRKKN